MGEVCPEEQFSGEVGNLASTMKAYEAQGCILDVVKGE